MIVPFLSLFVLSIAGIGFLVGRHIHEVLLMNEAVLIERQRIQKEQKKISVLKTAGDWLERFLKSYLFPACIHTLGEIIYIVERMGGVVSQTARSVRGALHKRSKVQPRMSSYWKEISYWKKKNRVNRVEQKDDEHTLYASEDQDISHH